MNCQFSGKSINECTCGYCSGELIRAGDAFLEDLRQKREFANTRKAWHDVSYTKPYMKLSKGYFNEVLN